MSYSKITSANLCKQIQDIKYSTSIYTFETGKCGKKKWKAVFIVFEGLSFTYLIKNRVQELGVRGVSSES